MSGALAHCTRLALRVGPCGADGVKVNLAWLRPAVIALVAAAVGLLPWTPPAGARPVVSWSEPTAIAVTGLRVVATGLPAGVVPRVVVTSAGSNSFRVVARTASVRVPAPGSYRVTFALERVGAAAYRPVVGAVTVSVLRGSTSRVEIAFRRVAPATRTGRFVIKPFVGTDVWVDAARGSDSRSGLTRASALATVGEAWRRIPAGRTLTRGVRINVVRGTYPASALVNYWEHRWGTASAPIIIRSVDGPHAARFTGDINAFDVRHLYLIGIDIIRAGDAFHCEACSYVLLRGMHLSGVGGAHETVKVNQSDHIYIEDSDVHGADDNAIDFVAVRSGHIVGNRIHGAQDWCAYVKGGSSGIAVVDNEIFGCGTGGFTAGQGTGFEFMTAPYLHYEAYGITVVGNLIHDTEGAGLGVNGGYNVLMAFNTMYRVGARSHAVEFVQGSRSCDAADAGESTAPCAARRALGGWGTTTSGGQYIPNRHVYFQNNVVANPPGYASRWSHFDVHSPTTPPADSGVANPSRADDDLVIEGNVFLNGSGAQDLGFNDGACGGTNAGCSQAFVRSHNVFGPSTRVFRDPAHGDYRVLAGSTPTSAGIVSLRSMSWADAPSRPTVPASVWSGPGVPALAHPGAWRTA